MDIASILGSLGSAATPGALDLAKKMGRNAYDSFIASYTNIFSEHLQATQQRCSSIKTILHRDIPVSLESQYVTIYFENSSETEIADAELSRTIEEVGSAIVICGLAGSGKSMFMKWCALNLIERIPHTQRIPLFVEVREITEEILSSNLENMIFSNISTNDSKSTIDQFIIGLSQGQFIIMLDGLDEVPIKYREKLLQSIFDFKRRFTKASIICSTRPDRQIESSNHLTVMRVKEMNLNQIVNVIENSLFDNTKKTAFIKSLKSNLYNEHKSFLSNPLLATIMLITYDVGVSVPNKLSLFYSQVYESLFFKHDSSKGVYEREHYSKLDIDEFERIFRTFCFQSYASSKVSFLRTDLTSSVKAAIKQSRSAVDANDFINDCTKSLCLMQEDGIYISFVHRSFQEYFTAKFIDSYNGPQYINLVDGIILKTFGDSTFRMLCEINPDDVLRRWAAPRLAALSDEISKICQNPSDGVAFLDKYVFAIIFDPDNGSVLNFSWGHRNTIRLVAGAGDLLRICGISLPIRLLECDLYSHPDSKREFIRIAEPETADEDDQDADEDGYTGRWEIQTSQISPELFSKSGLNTSLLKLKSQIDSALEIIQKQIYESDEFARHVGSALLDE